MVEAAPDGGEIMSGVSGILVLIGLGLLVGISYEWGKQGSIRKALRAIFDVEGW